jgi:hypothetical protein
VSARDPVETINSILRRAGHPVHCTWIPALRDLGDALTQLNPELLLYVDCGYESLVATVKVRDQIAPTVPLVVIADVVDEERIAAALLAGARDVVSLGNPERLQAVMGASCTPFDWSACSAPPSNPRAMRRRARHRAAALQRRHRARAGRHRR